MHNDFLGEKEMKRIFAAAVALGAAAVALAPTANAEPVEGFWLDKAEYQTYDHIRVSYHSAAKCEGKPSSDGFAHGVGEFQPDGPDVMSANARALAIVGEYQVSLRCNGEDVVRKFKVVPPTRTFLLDQPYFTPGEQISVHVPQIGSSCKHLEATSPGIVAPIKDFRYELPDYHSGTGKVVDQPGTYQMTMICDGKPAHQQFHVIEKPEERKAAPKKPVMKPKGAPQTGGGGFVR